MLAISVQTKLFILNWSRESRHQRALNFWSTIVCDSQWAWLNNAKLSVHISNYTFILEKSSESPHQWSFEFGAQSKLGNSQWARLSYSVKCVENYWRSQNPLPKPRRYAKCILALTQAQHLLSLRFTRLTSISAYQKIFILESREFQHRWAFDSSTIWVCNSQC